MAENKFEWTTRNKGIAAAVAVALILALSFGFLLDAFQYGPPPHGGMGIGLDRLIMQMIGAETLRDVVAFPKTKDASEPMTGCPDTVDQLQLDELHIKPAE